MKSANHMKIRLLRDRKSAKGEVVPNRRSPRCLISLMNSSWLGLVQICCRSFDPARMTVTKPLKTSCNRLLAHFTLGQLSEPTKRDNVWASVWPDGLFRDAKIVTGIAKATSTTVMTERMRRRIVTRWVRRVALARKSSSGGSGAEISLEGMGLWASSTGIWDEEGFLFSMAIVLPVFPWSY